MKSADKRELTFDPATHSYTLNGESVPSVTQVLSATGVSDYSKIPQDVLRQACLFGIAVHRTCELWDKATLNVATLDPALVPPLEAYIKFRDDYKFEVTQNELKISSVAHKYAGTLDRIGVPGVGKYKGKLTLIDMKTGLVLFAVRLQTAGYQLAYEEQAKEKIRARMCLHFPAEGGYTVHPLESDSDKYEWLSTLAYYRMMRREKLKMWGQN